MRADQFISDPIIQVNLLIWMAIEQPSEGFRVRPFFHEHGFELLYIEQPFPFPPEIRRQVEEAMIKAKFTIKLVPEPDLLLENRGQGKALYFEAKRSAFTAQSSNSEQARGHLLAAGPAFGEVFNGLDSCLLVYVVPSPGEQTMRQCLNELGRDLTALGLTVGNSSVNALAVSGNSVVYQLDSITAQHIGTSAGSVPLIEDLAEETDPSPLLLVYSDEDYPDEAGRGLYRRALQNQVIARLLCDLQHAPIRNDFPLNARNLLIGTTAGVFERLGKQRQTSMERLIVQNVFRRIAEFWSERIPGLVKVQHRQAIFHFVDDARKDDFLDWLESSKKTNFADTKPPESEQGDLFGME